MSELKPKPLPIKCSITQDDIVKFGSGGSNTIIVLTKNNHAYKFFPTYYNKLSTDHKKSIENEKKKMQREIAIGKKLSSSIVYKGISPHFLKYYGYGVCPNAYKLFSHCPKFITYMLEKEKDPLCRELYKSHPIRALEKEYYVLSMEYCDCSCEDFLKDISKMTSAKIKYYLDIFFFQIFYTLLKTKQVFPWFFHRDLFVRNILGTLNTKSNRYYRYYYKSMIFDVPVSMFMPKITDFGNSNLNEKYHDVKLTKDHRVDFYNITWDVYDGACLGSQSLSKLLENNPNKIAFLKKYFNTYFNVKRLDNLKRTNPNQINKGWYNTFDKNFSSFINYKEPTYLLKKYFLKLFPYDQTHEIEQEFN